MRIYHKILIVAAAIFVSSCEIDNMDGPDAIMYGEIIDAKTGELIGQDIFNGSLIRYTELGFDNPPVQQAFFKTDGTFRNNLMFSGKYDFFLNQGNFVPDTLRNVTLKKGENHVTFNVTPYIRISDVSIEQIGEGAVLAKFKLHQNTDDKVFKTGFFVHRESAVGDGIKYDKREKVINGNIPDGYEVSMVFPLDGTVKELKRGNQYYFRVGAMSSAPAAKYNYAPAVRLTLE